MSTARFISNVLPEEKESKRVQAAQKPIQDLPPPMGAVQTKEKIYTLQELALEFFIGTGTFFKLLRNKGILRSDNLPEKKYFRNGYLVVEKVPYQYSSGTIAFRPKTRVTSKGRDYFKKMFKAEITA